MGFCHTFVVKKPLSEENWNTLKLQLEKLHAGYLDYINMYIESERSFFKDMFDFIFPRDRTYASFKADGDHIDFSPEHNVRTLGHPITFSLVNKPGEYWVRSDANPYDYLIFGTVMLIQKLDPESISVKYSDADPEYFEFIHNHIENRNHFGINKLSYQMKEEGLNYE